MNVNEICPGVCHIEEDYRVYCTLVAGESSALLWDTGMGKRDLRAFAEEKLSVPYKVLNSHGHADHTGGNGRFAEVWLAREDWPLLASTPDYALKDLPVGCRFDLGGLTAECVSLAGHTRGSRGLLLRERRLLLAGDALNPRLQLLDDDENSLDMFCETLRGALTLPFDTYLTSHAPDPLPRDQAEAHLRHLEALDPGALRPLTLVGQPVWRAEWRQGPRRSVFLLGEAARRSLINQAR